MATHLSSTWFKRALSEKQTIDLLILDHRAGKLPEQPAMADRIGVVVPGGDLDLARIKRIERVRQVEDRQSLM